MKPDRDLYGGWTGRSYAVTGYFRLEEDRGRWWLVTPEGHPFLSHGVNHIGHGLLLNEYNREHWARQFRGKAEEFGVQSSGAASWPSSGATDDREDGGDRDAFMAAFYDKVRTDVSATGWNTLSCHNPDSLYENVRMPYIPTVRFVEMCHWMTPADDAFLDVWGANFESHCDEVAGRLVAPRAEDPFLLGYSFTDCPIWSDLDAAARETCIYGAKRDAVTTWPRRLRNLGGAEPGKAAYVSCLRELYRDRVAEFNTTYGTGFGSFDDLAGAVDWRPAVDPLNARELHDNTVFLNRTVDRYYEVVVGTTRRHDPNHMVFGDKLNGNTDVSDDLLRVVATHCDILFWQHYANADEHQVLLNRAARTTNMPQMNGDASLSCPDEHLPNPLGPHFATQSERARAYRELMRSCYARTDFLGYCWCGWLDRWESVQPMRQHSGVQDAFGNYHPIADEMREFEAEMYDVAAASVRDSREG